jgi:hypothetical protein
MASRSWRFVSEIRRVAVGIVRRGASTWLATTQPSRLERTTKIAKVAGWPTESGERPGKAREN